MMYYNLNITLREDGYDNESFFSNVDYTIADGFIEIVDQNKEIVAKYRWDYVVKFERSDVETPAAIKEPTAAR